MLGRPTALTLTLSQGGRGPRRGFTLVELLTVIVILGILAGLISAAVLAAMGKAKRAVVTLEINGLEAAARMFKEKYGDYPPDDMRSANEAAVDAFLRRAFPRYQKGTYGSVYLRFCADVPIACPGLNPASMDSASALVFWLGGLPRSTAAWIPDGFSQNVENPFQLRAVSAQRTEPLFEFQPERINWSGSLIHYYPKVSGARATNGGCPYVYFRARNNDYSASLSQLARTEETKSITVLPYINVQTDIWANPSTFQIISAGLDNLYGGTTGAAPTYPSGNYNGTTGHYDNLTNFTDGKLEDATP